MGPLKVKGSQKYPSDRDFYGLDFVRKYKECNYVIILKFMTMELCSKSSYLTCSTPKFWLIFIFVKRSVRQKKWLYSQALILITKTAPGHYCQNGNFCVHVNRMTHTHKILPIWFHRTQVWVLWESIGGKCGKWTSLHYPTRRLKPLTASKIIIFSK